MKTSSMELTNDWDIQLDDIGNIAIISNPLAVAQDVGCAISTFYGECFANRDIGVDYDFSDGKQIPYLTYLLEKEAKRLPIVKDVRCRLIKDKDEKGERKLSGVIYIRDTNNEDSTLDL